MSAGPASSAARRAGWRAWRPLLSLRTISGKLIIGLVVLFGLASVVVSVVTAQSLNHSLMSSLNQQLQSATDTWYNCVEHSTGRATTIPTTRRARPTPTATGCAAMRSGARHVRGNC